MRAIGLEFVMQLSVNDEERAGTVLAVSNKSGDWCPVLLLLTSFHRYYALSAACALFKYAETKLNMRFAAGSLCMRYVPLDGTMLIDPESARNLEIVGNVVHQKSTHSLFGWVEYHSR